MKLIGILGLKGSGKDTVGQYFSEQYGYEPLSFADSLKDCLSAIFGWERSMLEGRTPKSRAWREQVDHWWAERLNIPHFTPRFAMTNIGTDVMRQYFHDDIWLLNTERKIFLSEAPVVITDVRFPNELAMVERLEGVTIRVTRGDEPTWYKSAATLLSECPNPDDNTVNAFSNRNGVHPSEWLLANAPTRYRLDNSQTIPYLYAQAEDVARKEKLVVDL